MKSNFTSTRYLIFAFAILLLLPIGQALAADITVDADCSLPNAIRSANGEKLLEPLINCEAGDSADGAQDDDEMIPGLDTITIDVSGTDEGAITLDATLAVTSHIVIDGAGYSVNGGGHQILSITSGSLSVSDLTMSSGFSVENGGAISVRDGALTLNNSVVSGSGARGSGGGVYALNSELSLFDTVISGNEAGAASEAYAHLHVDDGSNHGHAETATELPEVEDVTGGGIYFAGESSSLVIDRSGLDSNASPARGGGVYIASGSANISNSTFSGNSAGLEGGGIYNAGASILTHVTVVGNTAVDAGGIVDGSLLQLYNSILSDNPGGDCSGSINANLGNIIRDNSCNHDGLTSDPKLLLLAGSPAYYVPQESSPAIDSAAPEYCLSVDQREIARLPDSCDMGAAEREAGVFSFQIQSALAAITPGSGGGSAQQEPEPEPVATETLSNCAELPGHIIVTGYTRSLSCSMLDWSGVGNQTLVNGGALQAVDLFGWVATTVEVCFQHDSGAIVLLDAANSPRNIVPLRSWTDGDKQCATVDRTGSAVLMPLTFFTSGAIPEPIWDLIGCSVKTSDILNLRQSPSGSSGVVANVLNDVTLTADQRATFFYRVDYYGIVGWLSKDYLSYSGSCN